MGGDRGTNFFHLIKRQKFLLAFFFFFFFCYLCKLVKRISKKVKYWRWRQSSVWLAKTGEDYRHICYFWSKSMKSINITKIYEPFLTNKHLFIFFTRTFCLTLCFFFVLSILLFFYRTFYHKILSAFLSFEIKMSMFIVKYSFFSSCIQWFQ